MKYEVIVVSGDHIQYLTFDNVKTVTSDDTSYFLLDSQSNKLFVAPISKVLAIHVPEE